MNVILSIKPKYANAILSGEKEYEFRKVIFKDKNVEKVYIYSSSPVKKIVGSFMVDDIIEGEPDNIWDMCKDHAGITKNNFFDYFQGKEKAYAIKIGETEIIPEPFDPRESYPDFTPPQSFCYFDKSPLKEAN